MKNVIKTVIILCILITSCNSQNKMDLSDIKLPAENNVFINKKYKLTESEYIAETGYTIYRSFDHDLLVFNGENISSNFEGDPDHNTNYGFFYMNNENKLFSLIKMTSFETDKTKLLHDALLEKFGTPNYYKSISFASYSVWENKKTKNIYFYEHNYGGKSNNIPFEEGILYIIDMNDETLINKYSIGGYTYYIKYLKQRNKDGKEYTYEEFAKKENEDGTDRYLKAISNPVKH
ncbi:hypothetical protein [uncultured Maribacter sp.]|uniref:hypothetical protein n=1 Tax=uncultured Maribacter sp. TaxID=431308 RepID=UPI00261681A9|nr:hypothetical protein [uncultured Maribacter sp.]